MNTPLGPPRSALIPGPRHTQDAAGKLAQERDMGYNEGWLQAVQHVEKLIVKFGLNRADMMWELDEMKGKRR